MNLQYLLPGLILLALGTTRLLLDGQWRVRGRAAVLGYLAVLLGGIMALAGLPL